MQHRHPVRHHERLPCPNRRTPARDVRQHPKVGAQFVWGDAGTDVAAAVIEVANVGISGSTAVISSRVSEPSPPELMEVVTSSVATAGEDGSSDLS